MPNIFDESVSASSDMQSPAATPTEQDERLAELQRIRIGSNFVRSPRLCTLLTYIVERSISGSGEDLTEQQIGINVFERSPGYNYSEDNIVRGTARLLRQKLATYYLTEGVDDPVRIEIPKGGYSARFEYIAAPTPEIPALPLQPAMAPNTVPRSIPERQDKKLLIALTTLVVVLCATVLWLLLRSSQRAASTKRPTDLLWATIFSPDRETILVPGDAGLNMYSLAEHKQVNLTDYSRGTYLEPTGNGEVSPGVPLGRRPYTTLADTQFIGGILQSPEVSPGKVQIRFARYLSTQDLRNGSNLILLGSESYNPWIDIFRPQLDLQLKFDVMNDIFTVDNRAPQGNEPRQFQWSQKDGARNGLTLVALTNNPRGEGRVLIIEGTTLSGIFAASDFLLNTHMADSVIAQAKRPDGTLRNFEVLLQWNFIREGVSDLHIVAQHIH
jgi:hypothetical protein